MADSLASGEGEPSPGRIRNLPALAAKAEHGKGHLGGDAFAIQCVWMIFFIFICLYMALSFKIHFHQFPYF